MPELKGFRGFATWGAVALAMTTLGWAVFNLSALHLLGLALTLVAATVFADMAELNWPSYGWEYAGLAIVLATTITYSLPVAILAMPVIVLTAMGHTRPTHQRLLTVTARFIIAATAAGSCAQGIWTTVTVLDASAFVAMLCGVASYSVVQTALSLLIGRHPCERSTYWISSSWFTWTLPVIGTWTTMLWAIDQVKVGFEGLMMLLLAGTLWLSGSVGERLRNGRKQGIEGLLLRVGRSNPLHPRNSERVADYCEAIARELRLNENHISEVRIAGLLCDIGMTDELTAFTSGSGTLTADERALIERHAGGGADLIASVPILGNVAETVRAHHERWDGTGYPYCLKENAIPLGSRIVAVAAAYVAMTSYRAYRAQMSPAEALAELTAGSGRQFWPEATAALQRVLERELGEQAAPIGNNGGELTRAVRSLQEYVERTQEGIFPWIRSVTPYGERERLLASLVALNELSGIISASLDAEVILRVATDVINNLARTDCGFVLCNEDGLIHSIHSADGHPPLGQPMPLAWLTGIDRVPDGPIVVPVSQLSSEAMRVRLAAQRVDRLFLVPLACRDRVNGICVVYMKTDASFDGSRTNLLLLVAAQVALALENARLYKETVRRLVEVREVQALNDSIIRDTAAGIIVVDLDGRVQRTSSQTSLLFAKVGYALPEGIGWSYADWVEHFGGGDSQLLRSMRERRELHAYDGNLTGPTGTLFMSCHTSPLRNVNGEITHYICLFVDTTEQHLLEQRAMQSEKLAALISLANGAANEVRNPLAAVRGFVQLLQQTEWPEGASQQAYLDIILSEVDRVDAVMQELLFLVKPVRTPRAGLDLPQLLDDVCHLTRSAATLKHVTLTAAYPRSLEPFIGDAGALKQVFVNIITNAIEATDRGGSITIGAEVRAGELHIRVSDTGCGIDAGEVHHLFDPFYTTKDRGTGLGLFVAYAIVRSHGGRIDVDSSLGRGSTFTIALPLAAAD